MKDTTPKMKNNLLIVCIMTVLLVIIGVIGLGLSFTPDNTQNENVSSFEDLLEFVNQSENNTTMFDTFVYVDNSTGVTYKVYGFNGTVIGMDIISE